MRLLTIIIVLSSVGLSLASTIFKKEPQIKLANGTQYDIISNSSGLDIFTGQNNNNGKSSSSSLLSSILQEFTKSGTDIDALRLKFITLLSKSKISSRRQCLVCRFVLNLIHHALLTERGYEEVNRISEKMCQTARWETETVCHQITRLFRDEVTKVLAYAIFTPDQVCGLISENKCGIFKDPMAPWEVPLEVAIQTTPTEPEFEGPEKSDGAFKVIHISDVHIDLEYKQGAPVVCDQPLCCQANSTVRTGTINRFEATFEEQSLLESGFNDLDNPRGAGYWGSYGTCDVPAHLLEALLYKINSTIKANTDIDYILWTGDIQPHDVWKQSKATAVNTYRAVFDLINKYLPQAKIFPTLGNHESVPVDSFSPPVMDHIAKDSAPKWLYQEMDKFWDKWLPDSTKDTIYQNGNYATRVRYDLKIISLNTNYCNSKNFWLYINSVDPGDQLKWLVHELQIAELLDEKVHIIGHIPPGSTDCLKQWSRNYNRIIRRYKRTITAQFYGHTHTSGFEIFYENPQLSVRNATNTTAKQQQQQWTPINVGFIGPSLTTFVDLNPSFRIYTIDPKQNYTATDFNTYYMNLTQVNAKYDATKDGTISADYPKWQEFGSFSRRFSLRDVSPANLHSLIMKASGPEPNQALYTLYRLYYGFSDMFGPEKFKNCDAECKRVFLCKFITSDSNNADFCRIYL